MIQTLDEAIKHCEEVAENNEDIANTFEYSLKTKKTCKECASEHRQLAEWLRELKAWRHNYANYSRVEKALICEVEKAIDDPGIRKPIAYALYQVWKEYDKFEEEREQYAKNRDDENGD